VAERGLAEFLTERRSAPRGERGGKESFLEDQSSKRLQRRGGWFLLDS